MESIDTRVVGILAELADNGSETGRAGMARLGVNADRAYGVKIPVLRTMAKRLGRDHQLAQTLWATGRHEARILAGYIAEPQELTRAGVDSWVADFDSWDLCDQVTDLFLPCPFLDDAIRDYVADEREFVRRAGFTLIAARAVRDKTANDDVFLAYLPLIEAQATDPRNFVRKAVNWALRQIGKRSLNLHPHALATAEQLAASPDRTARWIGRDAVKELRDDRILERLREKQQSGRG
ncbi:DNA alkylation repair protein [Devosia nitrariae]|uniref:DNA alkylation repair protein n=1 Tax=Devosia nitrariae TaxID=2071872 RepID=A0ABQ5WDZ7_9HYPH|nr:DNA alkylation repair protein [Devosia nitrariae]GLQ58155.1 hypothetical protein GCM10010862_54140 [Devosia nitrariae]